MTYTIDVLNERPLLRITMRGFWTMETFNAYVRDCGAAIQKLVAGHGRFDMLSDCNGFPVQGPDVSAGFERLKEMGSPAPQNRIAIVSSSALSRMQAERLMGGPHSRIFASEIAALEWLGHA